MNLARILFVVTLTAAAALASSAEPVSYNLRPALDEGRWHVMVRFSPPQPGSVDFWIPRWTPGAYHLAEYGKFVDELSAAAVGGSALEVERVSDCHWRIEAGEAEEVLVYYIGRSASKPGMTMRIDVLDVEANRIAEDYAYVSPASLLGFVPELIDSPVRLEVDLPEGWRTATSLVPAPAEDVEDADAPEAGGGVYEAASYYRLEDTPLFFSPRLETRSFEVEGKPHTVAVYGMKSAEKIDELAESCRKIVVAAAETMQGLPYERYAFLFGFTVGAQASGLEHADSTLIMAAPGVPLHMLEGVAAHEHFHVWVAERLAVEAIHRPDFTQRLETPSLWWNEGVTEYMARHILVRAGLLDREDLFDGIATNLREARPHLRRFGGSSWTEVSRETADWKSIMDLMGFAFRSYQLGPAVIMALDLEMRSASLGERGLIDLLRLMDHSVIRVDRGLREGEIMELASGVAQADLQSFYDSHIDGTDLPDFAAALAVIGYELQRNGDMVPLEDASEEQLRAREDYFALPPAR